MRASLIHFFRIAMVISIAVGLRSLSERRDSLNASTQPAGPSLQPSELQQWIADAEFIDEDATVDGMRSVRNGQRQLVGQLAQTLPQAAGIVGYRGPSNSLLVFDKNGRSLIGAQLLRSQDTPEHVARVREDRRFFEQFLGWSWSPSVSTKKIDAVSGATLTSLAIAEGIIVRLGGERPNLRFSSAIDLEEIQRVWPTADRLQRRLQRNYVLNASNQVLGWVLRSGIHVDAIDGYQGPTELFLAFNAEDKLIDGRIRYSYDNEPYVGYVRDESSFWKPYRHRSVDELASFNRVEAGIEGVSGATMTSLAVVDTLVVAAQRQIQAEQTAATVPRIRNIRWTWNDLGTIAVTLVGLLINATHWRGNRSLRQVWYAVLILYFGLCTGNLVSQALLMGWTAAGIPWRLAPGLVAVAMISLFWPVVTKRNVYCHHLCPHGAAQQLLRGRSRAWKLNERFAKLLRLLPGASLLLILVLTIAGVSFNAANFEPFDAYLWTISGGCSIGLALGTLALSIKVPLAYCRFGCPTGRLLEYVRRNGRSNRLTWSDAVALGLNLGVWVIL